MKPGKMMTTQKIVARAASITMAAGALMCATGLAASGASPDPATGTFDSLTYNVAGLPEPLSGSEPDINTPIISPLLNAYDLVLVQEDWDNPDPPLAGITVYHDLLVADVTHPYQSIPKPVPLGTDSLRSTALVSDGLNRLSRMPFGPVDRTMWTHCFGGGDTSDGGAGDCLSTKGFSVATTELAPGVEIDVYNLHGEAGSTALDEQYRAEGYADLAEYISIHSAGKAVLIGGDFNLHTDEVVDRAVFDTLLEATGLTDVCEVVDCGTDVDEIDKFLFRNGGGVTLVPLNHNFETETFTRPSDGAPLSDHEPLAVTWQWSYEPEPPSVGVTTTTSIASPTTQMNPNESPGSSGASPESAQVPVATELPRTGTSSTGQVIFGISIFVVGAAVVAGTRRRVVG